MEGDDFGWKPPSEAEMKVLQARRERSDKISKLMGDYLLKGYRMLGSCCSICGTILLRDRQQKDYCVCCSELDTDLAKDDPAVSARAARSQVEEHELSTASANQTPSPPAVVNGNHAAARLTPPGKRPRHAVPPKGTGPAQTSPSHRPKETQENPPPALSAGESGMVGRSACPRHCYENLALPRVLDLPAGSPDVVPETMESVMAKLYWAGRQLKVAPSVEASTQLCLLVKACADALTSLRYLVPGETKDWQ